MGDMKNGFYVIGDDVYQIINNFDGTVSFVPTPQTVRKWECDNNE